MKKTSKLIAAVLTLCMAIGLFTVTASAKTPKKIYFLGDSITTAYGTAAYTENAGIMLVDDREIIEGSYPSLVAKGMGLEPGDFSSNAHCGWRVNEAFAAAKGEEPDAYAKILLPLLDSITVEDASVDFAAEGKAISAGIGEADYISLNFGSNDIFSYAVFSLIGSGSLNIESISLPDFSDIKSAGDVVNAMKSFIGIAEDAGKLINEIEILMSEGFENFKTTYPLFLDYITDNMQSDAKVFVNSVISPLQLRIDAKDAFTLRLYTVLDKVASEANDFLKSLCDSYENVYYVNTKKTENYDIADSLSDLGSPDDPDAAFGVIAGLLKCTHADEAGHAYIAEQIMDAIERAETKPEVTVGYNALGQVQIKWNKIEGAVNYFVYRASEADGNYSLIGATPAKNWIDTLATADGTYYYKVTASMDALGQKLTEKSDPVAFSTADQPFVGKSLSQILTGIMDALVSVLTTPLNIVKNIAKIIKAL